MLDAVEADPDLSPQQRCNEMSAIRTLGAVDNTPLAAISLEDGYLFKDRYEARRQTLRFRAAIVARLELVYGPELSTLSEAEHTGR